MRRYLLSRVDRFIRWAVVRRRARIIAGLLEVAEYEQSIKDMGHFTSAEAEADFYRLIGKWRCLLLEQSVDAGCFRVACAIISNSMDPTTWDEAMKLVKEQLALAGK